MSCSVTGSLPSTLEKYVYLNNIFISYETVTTAQTVDNFQNTTPRLDYNAKCLHLDKTKKQRK